MKKQITLSIILAAIALASPVAAQEPAAPAPSTPAPGSVGDMRHHIYVMEGALARAVDYGAKQLNRQILAAMPGVFMLEGEARARGVHLEGYGVFFDVRVPMMRQSMVWSLRMMMDQDDAANLATISDLRKSLQGVTDPSTRIAIEKAVRQLESKTPGSRNPGVTPSAVMPNAANPAVGAATATGISSSSSPRPSASPAADSVWATDPNRAYTEAVTRALVDAMIDYSTPMAIAPDQWLTVAARDDEGRDSLAPQDPLEEVVTMIYRVKGGDLMAYRAGRIDRDEVRRRVQVTQF
ncbi:MAG: hypothetical protein ABI039_10115 [Vicinamibacterales bacterium]